MPLLKNCKTENNNTRQVHRKEERERHHGKNPDGSSSATYRKKEKAVNCNRYKLSFAEKFAQLTGFLARTADETLKSFPMDQHYYRSASNSLLARTADRTPKTFELQGARQAVTSHGII
ncbi:hypothetical protein AVEN_207118-1 [Araneus ventricosus]|uniref:Uncharacterized protein n=1 Tax=Araneus ventricosus TaxID=182803 RepID=A0A4Y2JH38_ARAVE|nr:hypothetical protein AVEN_207118-1 [Araneus ventricosus]